MEDMHNTLLKKSALHRFASGLTTLGLIVIVNSALTSQPRGPAAAPKGSHDMMILAVSVSKDRINLGSEYLPRRTDSPNSLIVSGGETVELRADATYDYIEVGGTLTVSRSHDTTARFTTLIILPGGYLDVGTQADPIPCNRTVELIIRDVPIDLTKDPFQWGNGLVNFGRQTRVGCTKTSFVETTGSLSQGASNVPLASTPAGWQVGDEVLIPDTVTPASNAMARRESKVTITSISGSSLSLSKGLDFAHPNITDPQGEVVLRPRVANVTRNIWLHSENQNGSRGHTVDIGKGSTWDIRYNRFSGLGRTQNTPLEDTVPATGHIGTNQRGKYTEHHHHAESSVGSSDVGNVLVGAGSPASKWGLAVHGTSDTLVQDNIAVDFPGAGFVTEDGYEVRNTFRHNFAMASFGNDVFDASSNIKRECPGCEGTGFWFRGVMNSFESNEGWNNKRAGILFINQQQPAGMYPSVPGGPLDTVFNYATALPVSLKDNVLAANAIGLEQWGFLRFPDENLIAAYNSTQAMNVISEGVAFWLKNPKLICAVGKDQTGVHSSAGYVFSLETNGGHIAGCALGIDGGGGKEFAKVIGTTMQNEFNINMIPASGRFLVENVTFVPLANYPHKNIYMYNGLESNRVWPGTGSYPNLGFDPWGVPNYGSLAVVKNWQGTGQNYLLFYEQQKGSHPAWYSTSTVTAYSPPIKGLTMQQAWENLGMGFLGDMVKDSEAILLDGVIAGYGRAGLAVNVPAPRAIVTFPTMRERAQIINSGQIRIHAVITGDRNAASDVMMASVDNDPPKPVYTYNEDNIAGDELTNRTFLTDHVSAGTHTVKVWRTQKNNPTKVLAGSEYTSQYCVGDCPNIPKGTIGLAPQSMNFAGMSGGTPPPSRTLVITNTGVGTLNWLVTSNQNWCGTSFPHSGSLSPGSTQNVVVYMSAPTNVGTLTCTVSVSSDSADNSPQALTVNYAVTGSPNPNQAEGLKKLFVR